MNLLKDIGFDEDYILEQIRSDYTAGDDAMYSIRDKWDRQLKLYNNQKRKSKKEKLGDTTVYNIHSALLARLYLSGVETVFEGTIVGDEIIADNVTASYAEDMETPEMASMKYQYLWDTLFYGMGVVCKDGWDGYDKKATFQVIDPRLIVPDPQGDYVSKKYRFIGFKQLVSKEELKSMGLYNEDLLAVKSNGGKNDTAYDIQRKDKENEDVYSYDLGSENNELHNIFYYFGIFGGKKYCIITGNDQQLILGYKEFKAVTKKEKKDPSRIPFPFEFSHYRPQRGLITGKSVPDDTEEVQRAKAMISNLRFDKSLAELYPMYLYNTRLIKNKADLDFGFNKLISVSPLEGEPLTNAVSPIQKDFRADNSYLIENSLDQQVERATSIGNLQQSSEPSRRETATTNKLQQSNADININLTANILKWSYLGVARLRYRGILENMTDGDGKNATIYNGFSYVPVRFHRADLVREDEFKINIKIESEVTKRKQKEIQAFNMSLPIIQSAGIPKSSNNYLLRDFLRNLGYHEKKVWVAVPQTPDEVLVMQDIEALNAGARIMPNEDVDVNTALLLIKQAKPGLNTEMYRNKLLEMYIASVKEQKEAGVIPGQEQAQEQQSIKNNVAAQAGAGLFNMSQDFTG